MSAANSLEALAMLAAFCLGGAHLFGRVESRTHFAPSSLVQLSQGRQIELVDVITDDIGQQDPGPARHRVGLALMSRGPELSAAPIGLRAIQRRLGGEMFGRRSGKRDGSQRTFNASDDELVFEWARQKRWAGEQVATLNEANAPSRHKFVYLVSPMSQLAHPIEAERLAQGYRSLLPLSGSYRTALQRVAPSVDVGTLSEADYQLEDVCQTRRERVQLTRDETEPASGRLLRRCSGQVELNTCAGTCPSGVQPSIKSPSGFAKRCACCNEAAFRRLQVRLSDCSPVAAATLDIGQNEQVGQANFMDVEVEEPIDCACRQCEGLI